MEQTEMPLLQRIDGPSAAPRHYVKLCGTYRQACRMAWKLSRIKNQRSLVEVTGMRRQHVSDYLHPDDKPTRRSLPAQRIADFEAFVGNTVVSQWVAAQSHLTVLEELQAERAVA